MSKRVPAEWEPHEATWLQWPGPWEKVYEPAFAQMAKIVPGYEKLHILCHSETVCNPAQSALESIGGDPEHPNIIWHQVPNDSAWMRDNGPLYVVEDDRLQVQNWQFDAWGGAFGEDIAYGHDNRVPIHVGRYLSLPVDTVEIVHEKCRNRCRGQTTDRNLLPGARCIHCRNARILVRRRRGSLSYQRPAGNLNSACASTFRDTPRRIFGLPTGL